MRCFVPRSAPRRRVYQRRGRPLRASDMPALIESEHPVCAELMRAYKHCSATASLFSKVAFSACTTEKYRLDACFREEKLARTRRNLGKSKARGAAAPAEARVATSI